MDCPVLHFTTTYNNVNISMTFNENLSYKILWDKISNNIDNIKEAVAYWYNLISKISSDNNDEDMYDYCDCIEFDNDQNPRGMMLCHHTILTNLHSRRNKIINKNIEIFHVSGNFDSVAIDWKSNKDGRLAVEFIPISGKFRMYRKSKIGE